MNNSRDEEGKISNAVRRPIDWFLFFWVSGLAALGAEAVWTRLISLFLGGPVYAFSILLGAFLAGLVLGSLLSSKLVEYRITAQRAALGLVQFLLVPALFLAALTVTRIVPALSAASP